MDPIRGSHLGRRPSVPPLCRPDTCKPPTFAHYSNKPLASREPSTHAGLDERAIAQFPAPSSCPAKRAFFRFRAIGRMVRSTVLLPISMHLLVTKSFGPSQYMAMYQPCWSRSLNGAIGAGPARISGAADDNAAELRRDYIQPAKNILPNAMQAAAADANLAFKFYHLFDMGKMLRLPGEVSPCSRSRYP
jgi:hypothetical protein